MPGLLIIAHAPLASSLKAVAQHAFPECAARLQALDVEPDTPVDEVEAQARRLLAEVGSPDVLILTDVFGATPCNVALRLAEGAPVKIVAGVNVPMLWRTLCYSDDTVEAAVERALSGATQGVMPVTVSRPQNQTRKAGGGDPQDHQDQ
jgi:PTS system mannose-specific IIA component